MFHLSMRQLKVTNYNNKFIELSDRSEVENGGDIVFKNVVMIGRVFEDRASE